MSEYQSDYEHLQSNRTNDSLQQDTAESLQILDNRNQSVTQKTIQKKLAKFKQAQSADIIQREGGLEDEELPVQRKCITTQLVPEEEELPVQGKSMTAQRVGNPEDEEPIQGKFDNGTTVSSQLEAQPSKPNTTGLPDNLKSGVENLSGLSLDDVQVHYNSDKPTQLQALAYTQGTDIHVAPGQEQHLPHEAWHVVQQMQGRVLPTIEMNGGVQVNDEVGLESEADVMGGRAV
ncbi:MAG: DUF4157 domain-containing protein [Chitinispirillaceae bacterium]|nr:DUF4157 domain-containing protein [Chitinispirillaceae bacterium]